jgi:hypothetical protein
LPASSGIVDRLLSGVLRTNLYCPGNIMQV